MEFSGVMGQSAGQSETLVVRLRGLIRDYPSGVGIAREFIQNADDAGANWIRFTLDLQQHSTAALPDPRMVGLMGPALLITSDQSFSEQDLISIQHIGEGSKRRSGARTGRFGLGFNSVYNLTDYPAFATRDRIVCFDPHLDAVALGDRPGRQWSLQDLWRHTPDWPSAFRLNHDQWTLQETTFRLPLRTAAQVGDARIGHEPTSPELVLAIFEELERMGPSLLLFARHLQRLEAQVVGADGVSSTVLLVETRNPEPVKTSRAAIVSACEGVPADLIRRWRGSPGRLPQRVWLHHFRVSGAGGVRHESWFVSSGLFRGVNDELLDMAQAMADIGEKALPLAGAAALLERMGDEVWLPRPVEGALYCSLPLPCDSPLPFHINGYFDLDSSRTQLFSDERALGDAHVRYRWNQALLVHAIPPVVALLFQPMAERLASSDPQRLYALWPQFERVWDSVLNTLAVPLYRALATARLLYNRVAYGKEWRSAEDSLLPALPWSEDLRRAFVEDGLDVVEPLPPAHVLSGLSRVECLPRRWTPEMLVNWLRHVPWQDVKVAESPLHALATPARVVEILSFVSQQSNLKLEGLPLALRQDGLLCDFRPDLNLYLTSEVMRAILVIRPDLLLDERLERLGVVLPDPRAGVSTLEVDGLLFYLRDILKVGNLGWLPWDPDGDTPPHRAWLAQVLTCISRRESRPFKEKVFELALIPDESGRLWRAGLSSTPLLENGSLTEQERLALATFKVPMLEVQGTLRLALEALRQTFSGAVPPLALTGVVEALITFEGEGRGIPADAPERIILLNWMCREDRAHPLPDRILRRLASVVLWPTAQGQIVAADARGVYLPADFEPPIPSQEVVYLSAGPDGLWRTLLNRLGVRPLELANYVSEQLIPAIRQGEGRAELLRWLKDSRVPELLIHAPDPVEGERVLRRLRQTPLFPGPGGNLFAAAELYHPTSRLCREVLGELAVMPDLAGESDLPGWYKFFDQLGLWTEPRPRDIFARVQMLAARASLEGWPEICGHLWRVMDHLHARWESIKEVEVGDKEETLGQLLAREVWLPAVRQVDHFPLFVAPADLIFRPRDLQRPQFLESCGGVEPVLDSGGRSFGASFLTDLGLAAAPPLNSLLQQLRQLRQRWELGDLSITVEEMGHWCDRLYLMMGRQLSGTGQGMTRLSLVPGEATVWDPASATFWPGEFTFSRVPPALTGCRARRNEGGEIGLCLDHFGRRSEPEAADYLLVLSEIATGPIRYEPPRTRQILNLFEELGHLQGDLHGGHLMTTLGELREAASVVVDDSPRWRTRARGCDIHWLHPGISRELARRMGTPTISSVLTEEIISCQDSSHPDLIKLTADLGSRLDDPRLKEGILRLLEIAEGHPVRVNLDLTLKPVAQLKTAVYGVPLGWDGPRAVEYVDTCWLNRQFYVASSDVEVVIPLLAQVVIELCHPASVVDRAALEQLFRVESGRIAEMLDRRGVPPLKTTDSDDIDQHVQIKQLSTVFTPVFSPPLVDEGDMLEQTLGQLFLEDDEQFEEEREEVISLPAPAGVSPGGVGADSQQETAPEYSQSDSMLNQIGPPVLMESNHPHLVEVPRAGSEEPPSTLPHPAPDPLRGEMTLTLTEGETEVDGSLQVAAVEFAWKHEVAMGLQVTKVVDEPHFCDLQVCGHTPDDMVWVRVKALKGAWEKDSLYLSRRELQVAEELGPSWRLYVVEFAGSKQQRLLRLNNVLSQAMVYRLDVRWRPVVSTDTTLEPDVGLWVKDEAGVVGRIERVATYGVTKWLTLRMQSGDKKRIMYEADRHNVSEVAS